MHITNLALIGQHFLQARWRWQVLRGKSLAEYQEQRAQQMVRYVHAHSPFYREHWGEHDLKQWRTLPTVDKLQMMTHFDRFTTRGISHEKAMQVAVRAEQSRDFVPGVQGLTVGLSSGTSGHRGIFLVSPHEQAAWAGTILARLLHGWRPRKLKVAFFLRSNSNLYEEVGGTLLQFRYFDLMAPLNEAVVTLNSFQPDIVIGPPSLLGFLADARQQNQLTIRPERFISVAEVLEEQDAERLQQVFQVPVHQVYQCTEGLLAISCEHGSLHVQEDLVALQFEPVVEDEPERVTPIVTDLWRQTQPIIRYRLNDVLRLGTGSCPCGSPFQVITAIEGRCDDVCYFTMHDGQMRPFFPDTLRRMVLLASPDITDYQVMQEAPNHIRVHIAVAPHDDLEQVTHAVRESIVATLQQYGCHTHHIEIRERMPTRVLGHKRRRVQRLYTLEGVRV